MSKGSRTQTPRTSAVPWERDDMGVVDSLGRLVVPSVVAGTEDDACDTAGLIAAAPSLRIRLDVSTRVLKRADAIFKRLGYATKSSIRHDIRAEVQFNKKLLRTNKL